MDITKKKILKTAIMPEYIPRLLQLFGSGFSTLSYLIAVVFNTVRILPDNHPYLSSGQDQKPTIRQVMAAAANNIVFKKENIDQILVFFSIIAAIIILFIQFCLLALSVVIPKSYAANAIPNSILDFFVTPSPNDDIAFQLLNFVFGIPQFFGGAASVEEPIHTALHSLFAFYSYGILIVGTFIIIYMVITTLAETAQSGIPFGRRFNKAWAPVRIILFFALLLPFALGLNSAQYITLAASKLGSGLASQGWIAYNTVIASNGSTLTGTSDQNIATPKMENLMHLPAFMMVVKTCYFVYEFHENSEYFHDAWRNPGIIPWAVYQTANNQWQSTPFLNTTYENLITLSEGRDIFVIFGVQDRNIYSQQRDGVYPACGSLVLKAIDSSQPGSAVIREAYYEMIRNMWNGTGGLYARLNNYAEEYGRMALPFYNPREIQKPPENFKKEWQDYFRTTMEGPNGNGGVIGNAVQQQINNTDWTVNQQMLNLGWAGAGIWYNKIAEHNGALTATLRNSPSPMLYADVMEKIDKYNRSENVESNPIDRFTPHFSNATPSIFINDYEIQISRAVNAAYQYWNKDTLANNAEIAATGNAFIDIINVVLGTQGLFDLCANTNIHPLAQLSAVGKSMLENSIAAFGGSALFALFGVQPLFQATTTSISEFFGTIAGVGLLIGFILFYVLPFMPFIYFFFAVGAWIKTIFEAMVAMPLWALAHLRIDGEGIVGEVAIKGYYLIFEIFIRPILIVIGLIASIVIFAAMVKILNEIFYLVISNMAGHNSNTGTTCFQGAVNEGVIANTTEAIQQQQGIRGSVDEFFFTVLYAITVYIIGTSCFKLIDGIPNNILRWFNAEVASFADQAGDAAEGLMKYVTLGGQQFGSQIGSSISGLGGGIKKTAQNITAAGFSE